VPDAPDLAALVAGVPHDHVWPVFGAWGVIIGVTRCSVCGTVARPEHFPTVRAFEEASR